MDVIELERELERKERWTRYEQLVTDRGQRYHDCTFKSFEVKNDEQRTAIADLRKYARILPDQVRAGRGVVIFGPKGTGKDHLAMALTGAAIVEHGMTVTWANGADLAGDFRDAIGRGGSEVELVRHLTGPEILYLSDPLPPVGTLTEFQASCLFRVLDSRYNRHKPTWATVNVTGRPELDRRMGPQIADRLIDDALCVFCNWQSYRRQGGNRK